MPEANGHPTEESCDVNNHEVPKCDAVEVNAPTVLSTPTEDSVDKAAEVAVFSCD